MRQIKKIRVSQKGFTLIELMATLAILAMVVAIAVPAVGKIMDNAEAQAEQSSIALIESSGELAYLGGLEFDDTERKSYNVPTLVDKGYLTLSEDDVLYDNQNYVQQTSIGTFVFNGGISEGETPNNPVVIAESDLIFETYDNDSKVRVFEYLGNDKDIIIPDTINGIPVTEIANAPLVDALPTQSFSFKDLNSVVIPSTVTRIGSSAFYGNNLTSVTFLPNSSLESIGMSSFSHNKIESIDLPNTVKSIGVAALSVNSLKHIVIPNGVSSIGFYSFFDNPIESVTLPATVIDINNTAFDLPEGQPYSFTVYGYTGSQGEQYADSNGHTFVPLD